MIHMLHTEGFKLDVIINKSKYYLKLQEEL
jgi:hypothetical protein